MINAKDITVVIPTGGKREHLLRRAVMSVVSQSESVSKILVIWDGDDAPFAYLTTLDDSVEIVKTPVAFGGVSRARQLGVELAKTKLVCILDDDDYWIKTKISSQIEILKHHNNPDDIFSFSRSVLEYEDGTYKSIVPISKFRKSQSLGDFFFRGIPSQNSRKTCSSSTYLFSRQLALNHPFRSDLLADEDTDFILRIDNHCKVFYIHQVLVHSTYRDSGGAGLSHAERNIEEWLKWIQGMSDIVETRIISNIKIVYGVRHYLKQNRDKEALRLWLSTLREDPDLRSAGTGLCLFLRKLINR
jgi:glycosyltransferase involved in cell wall biosynthesis